MICVYVQDIKPSIESHICSNLEQAEHLCMIYSVYFSAGNKGLQMEYLLNPLNQKGKFLQIGFYMTGTEVIRFHLQKSC